MNNVIKNAKDLYKFREKIINEIKKVRESEEFGERRVRKHGSKDELKDLAGKVSVAKVFKLEKNKKFIKRIDPSKLSMFLSDVLKGEINNIKDETEVSLNNINEDYNAILNAGDKRKSNSKNMKNYINETMVHSYRTKFYSKTSSRN